MEEIDLKIFGARLKRIAKNEFGSVGNLAEKMGMKNISTYISGAREPGLNIIYRLFRAGININELIDERKEENYKMRKDYEKENEKLLKSNQELKAKLYDLGERIKEFEKTTEKLLSQVVTLDKANKMKRSNST